MVLETDQSDNYQTRYLGMGKQVGTFSVQGFDLHLHTVKAARPYNNLSDFPPGQTGPGARKHIMPELWSIATGLVLVHTP